MAGDGTTDGTGCNIIQNECDLNIDTCHPEAFCGNTLLGFTCTCNEGFDGDGSLLGNGCEQIDIDECAIGLDTCDQNCQNVANGFTCSCNEGFLT